MPQMFKLLLTVVIKNKRGSQLAPRHPFLKDTRNVPYPLLSFDGRTSALPSIFRAANIRYFLRLRNINVIIRTIIRKNRTPFFMI